MKINLLDTWTEQTGQDSNDQKSQTDLVHDRQVRHSRQDRLKDSREELTEQLGRENGASRTSRRGRSTLEHIPDTH